jgi:hypothetical protein
MQDGLTYLRIQAAAVDRRHKLAFRPTKKGNGQQFWVKVEAEPDL